MTSFYEALSLELDNERELLSRLKKDPVSPQRVSIIAKHQKKAVYYYKNEKKTNKRIYLGRSDSDKLRKVVRQAYKAALIELLKENEKNLDELKRVYNHYDSTSVMAKLSPCIRDIDFDISADYIMKDLFRWAHETYEKNSIPFGDQVIIAKDGTRVRSKSECIIYNMLLDAVIPFRYDPVLRFTFINEKGEKISVAKAPDFQIICPDRSFILIEHAGMLKKEHYSCVLAKKIQIYLTNGYILGYSLFVTGDGITGGIDSAEIDKMIKSISARFAFI